MATFQLNLLVQRKKFQQQKLTVKATFHKKDYKTVEQGQWVRVTS